jgi:hypothetical protein
MASEGRSVRTDEADLRITGYGGQFSSYWVTDVALNDLLESVERYDSPSPDSPVVLDGDGPYEDIDYRELRAAGEPPAPFVAVYAGDYVLTWEEYEGDVRVGVRSERDLHQFVVDLFEETADTEVSRDDEDLVESFVSENVV